MNEETKRLIYAVAFAVVSAVSILGTTGEPHTVLGWIGITFTSLLTGYGKYSTSSRPFLPDRQGWTHVEREEKLSGKLN